ncbi:hypothetical protein C2U68_03465 [Methylomonas koyamae]|nr:hypothetical protein C2U68_03465 [Methylomonas koyamae]
MFCYNCGEKNKYIAIFCKRCGVKMAIEESILNVKTSKDSSGFLGEIFSFFRNMVEYTIQIIISAIVSFAVLYGLLWAWAKYGTQN